MNQYFKHLSVLLSNKVNIDRYDPQKQSSTKLKEHKEFQHQKFEKHY